MYMIILIIKMKVRLWRENYPLKEKYMNMSLFRIPYFYKNRGYPLEDFFKY